jgi:hypothetical protein
MARLPRLVIPGHPHHLTPRGNRRAQTFFEEGDWGPLQIITDREPTSGLNGLRS